MKKKKKFFKKTEILPNLHQFGILPEKYDKYPILKDYFIINSLSQDIDGKTFVNSVEGKKYPIYGVQFHPEMIPYSKFEINKVPSSIEASEIYQRFGKYFLSQALLLNNNTMSTEDLVKYDFIDSFTKMPVKDEGGWFHYAYQKLNNNSK